MSKNLKIFIVVFALAGSIALIGAIANVEGFEIIKTVSYWTSCALGFGLMIKVLLWDWKEAKNDSKDRSFRLRK